MTAADKEVAACQPCDVHSLFCVLEFRAHVIGRRDDVDLVTVVDKPMCTFPNVACNATGPRRWWVLTRYEGHSHLQLLGLSRHSPVHQPETNSSADRAAKSILGIFRSRPPS